MRVDKSIWQSAMDNLIERRKTFVKSNMYNPIGDYRLHLSKIEIGRSVLDVGCGSMAVKSMLPEGIEYVGIDAFPVNQDVFKMEIEDCSFEDNSFDTVICFAALDGLHDLGKALMHMKRICRKNILFLTGVNIEPDKFHTFKITEDYLIKSMEGFHIGYKEYFNKNVLLIEFKSS